MSKPSFSLLDFEKRYYFDNKKNIRRNIIGIDTETYKGKAILIADSKGNFIEPNTFEDVLNFLTKQEYRYTFNFFYNVRFDFQALIKYLSEEQIIDLWNTKELLYDKYKFFYIPKKCFFIQDLKNKYSFRFFDAANFLSGGLDYNAKKYLNLEKKKNVNSKRINEDAEYYFLNRKKIIEYCNYDAILTKKLGLVIQRWFYKILKFYPQNYISKATISKAYYKRNCYVPDFLNIKVEENNEYNKFNVIEYAYNSFFGARFEIFKKGYFNELWKYDIISAYPNTIQNLISINTGKFKKVKERGDGVYGYYKVKITDFNDYISFFPQKINGLTIFGNGIYETYITSIEYDILNKLTNIEIIDGFEYFPDKIIKPFYNATQKLYKVKSESKKESSEYWSAKILLNSIYGSFWEKYEYIDIYGKKRYRLGKFFNPFYATNITAETRIKVIKDLRKNELKNVCSFCSDGIISDKKLNIPLGNNLGDWKLEEKKEKGVILMVGVYQIGEDFYNRGFVTSEEMKDEKDEKNKKKSLIELLKKNSKKNTIKLKYKKNITIGEIYPSINPNRDMNTEFKKTIEDLNSIFWQVKNININGDKKRIWEKDFKNCDEFLSENIESMPLLI